MLLFISMVHQFRASLAQLEFGKLQGSVLDFVIKPYHRSNSWEWKISKLPFCLLWWVINHVFTALPEKLQLQNFWVLSCIQRLKYTGMDIIF